MRSLVSSWINKIPTVFFLVFLIPLSAMEQNREKLKEIPFELQEVIFLEGMIDKDLKKSIGMVHNLRRVNKGVKSIIEKDLLKKIGKKFSISKIQIRYMLHIPEMQQTLLQRIKLITRYALVYCDILLREPLSRTRNYSEEKLASVALERAYEELKQKRKDNPQLWNDENHDFLTIAVKPSDGADKAEKIKALLHCLYGNCAEIISDTSLQKELKKYKNFYSFLIIEAQNKVKKSPSS
jgi:hypothetical protein